MKAIATLRNVSENKAKQKMFYLNINKNVFLKSFTLTTRFYTHPANEDVLMNSKINFFKQILDLRRSPAAAKKILMKNESLFSLNEEDVQNSVKFLNNIGIPVEAIRKQPTILVYKEITLRNRFEILLECGCSKDKVNATHLNSYIKLMNQTEEILKMKEIIPNDIDVQERLAQILNVKLHTRLENAALKTIRWNILKLFYSQNNIMTPVEYDKLVKHYPNGKHKSYCVTKDLLELLVSHVKIPKDKIKNNFFIMNADPENIRKLLTMKAIGDMKMQEILRIHPRILMSSHESIQKILNYIKDFGITEESVTKCFRILTLGSETVFERLNDLNKIKELQVMTDHPRILSVVVQKSLTAARMEYLKLLHRKCFSLNTLIDSVSKFQKYTRRGADKNRERDSLDFLAKIFNKDMSQIRDEISKHLYWLNISFFDMKRTIEELQNAGFNLEDIYSNIQIILYSPELILTRLKKLTETKQVEGISTENMTDGLKLKMVLYSIEFDHHFSGEGVLVERSTIDGLELPNIGTVFGSQRVKKILDRKK